MNSEQFNKSIENDIVTLAERTISNWGPNPIAKVLYTIASSMVLGPREIMLLADVVSQFNIYLEEVYSNRIEIAKKENDSVESFDWNLMFDEMKGNYPDDLPKPYPSCDTDDSDDLFVML